MRICNLSCLDVCPSTPEEIYTNLPCACAPKLGESFPTQFLLFFFLLARGLLTYFPFPGLATQKITLFQSWLLMPN